MVTAHRCPGACRQRFATRALLDAHRRRGHCTDPANAGLARIAGVWTDLSVLIGAEA